MKDIRVPGIVWAIAMVAIVAILHENADAWHISPLYSDLAVVVVVGVLKGMNLGVDQLNQALDIIDNIRATGSITRTRGVNVMGETETTGLSPVVVESMTANAPERPSKTVRWLLG